ncbi:MAG TPA: LamG-like jellyroll fold domain-containing protein, partial [Luteimonas sp.]|nr:LamG-like jellyroll fold domain-containing protein [Luteimonas sp.]
LVVPGATEPVTWSISDGALPAGLALGSSMTDTVEISGVPTATGYATFKIKAVDADARVEEKEFTIGIGTVKTLLHFNGTHGSTTFTDETGRVWTRGGNTIISTTQSKFGGASAFFDGGADYINTPYTADWNFNAGDWALDFYAYMTSASGGSLFGTMFSKRASGADCDLIIYNAGQTLNVKYGDSGGSNKNMACGEFLLNTLYRVTVGRKDSKLYCAVDGQIRNSVTIVGSMLNRSLPPEMGKSQGFGDSYFKGYIDEFKLITGATLFVDDQPGYLEAESDYPVP